MGVVSEDFLKVITVCAHCGEPSSKERFCKLCKTVAQRNEMDNENIEIFEAAGLTFIPPRVSAF